MFWDKHFFTFQLVIFVEVVFVGISRHIHVHVSCLSFAHVKTDCLFLYVAKLMEAYLHLFVANVEGSRGIARSGILRTSFDKAVHVAKKVSVQALLSSRHLFKPWNRVHKFTDA